MDSAGPYRAVSESAPVATAVLDADMLEMDVDAEMALVLGRDMASLQSVAVADRSLYEAKRRGGERWPIC